MRAVLHEMYERLAAHFGPTGWWPADTPFEVAVGAILTQNTSWRSVEKAIAELKRRRMLSAKAIGACPDGLLEEILRPTGYFRIKAQRLRSFCVHLVGRYGGSMKRMAARPLEELRPELLAVPGIGPETADDILCYACDKPVFVVDAYTQRILHRHGLIAAPMKYEALRRLLEDHLEPDLHLYKEFHGLLDYAGARYCRRAPRCDECPLGPLLRPGQPVPLPGK